MYYGKIRSYRERLRPYTELVTVDLGKDQNRTIKALVEKINQFELKMSLNNVKINSYETVRSFRFYFVDPIIKRMNKQKLTSFRNWSNLTSN
jgi:predicted component of viral defense system (DUF524 family)